MSGFRTVKSPLAMWQPTKEIKDLWKTVKCFLLLGTLLPVAVSGEEVTLQWEMGKVNKNVAELKRLICMYIDQSNKIKDWLPILADLLR